MTMLLIKPRYERRVEVQPSAISGRPLTGSNFMIWDNLMDTCLVDSDGNPVLIQLTLTNGQETYDLILKCEEMNRNWEEEVAYDNLMTEYLGE